MKRKVLFLPLLMMAVTLMAAESIKVVSLNGSDRTISLQRIGTITFSDDVMYLYDTEGNLLGNTPVSQVGQIVFTDEPDNTAVDNVARPSVSVYPNPAYDMLEISGLEGQTAVRIYNLQGQLLRQAVVAEDKATLDVSALSAGHYLLQIGAEVMKIIKE